MMSFFLFATVMAIPHLFYLFIWTLPQKYMQLVNQHFPGKDSVEVMASFASLFKAIQFTAYTIFWLSLGTVEFGQLSFIRFLLFAILVGAGQALNIGIYKAIGINGVYYGCRLGKEVPWYEGFPFTVLGHKCPHPQYIGSVMTFWGVAFLLHNAEHHFPLYYVAALMTGYYAFTGYIEDKY